MSKASLAVVSIKHGFHEALGPCNVVAIRYTFEVRGNVDAIILRHDTNVIAHVLDIPCESWPISGLYYYKKRFGLVRFGKLAQCRQWNSHGTLELMLQRAELLCRRQPVA